MARRALEKVRAQLAVDADAGDTGELEQLDAQAERLVEAIASAGQVQELANKLREVTDRRDALRAHASGTFTALDDDELSRRIDRSLGDVKELLRSDGCKALAALFGDERLRVYSDSERGVRVEGTATLTLDAGNARSDKHSGRSMYLGAGAGYVPGESQFRVQLFLVG